MRKILAVAFVIVLAALYVVWPLWAGWSIREALKNGDSHYLEAAVDWPSVKATLKPSLIDWARGPHNADPVDASYWAVVTTYMGNLTADALVERFATPSGLPLLFAYSKVYREKIKGQVDETDKLPFAERMERFWTRLKRAAFTSPTRFEFLLADKFTPERLYDGALEVRGFGWKLTELRVKMTAPKTSSESASPSRFSR